MPREPREFEFSLEKTGLTRFGGLSLFQSAFYADIVPG
jgi:hypothetical protein